MKDNLYNRANFIKGTLGMGDAMFEEKMRKAFCEKYGRKADLISGEYMLNHVLDKMDNETYHRYDWKAVYSDLNHKAGLYALYSYGKYAPVLNYIGKSVNLFSRIPSSMRQQGIRYATSYLVLDNTADMDILELLYIAKYKPSCNKDCNRTDMPSIFDGVFDEFVDISKFSEIPKKEKRK